MYLSAELLIFNVDVNATAIPQIVPFTMFEGGERNG